MFSRTFPSLRCAKVTTVLSALLLGSGNVTALGLGDLVVHSRLGQALRAEIRLMETPGTNNPGETCFRLGEAVGTEDLPVLTQGRLRLEQSGGRNRLVVTSSQTINEPALLLNVHVGCGAELVRSYTLLIDPAEPGGLTLSAAALKDEPDAAHGPAKIRDSSLPATEAYPTVWEVVDGESAQSITKALFPRQPRAQRRFLNALRDANPQVDLGEKGEQQLAAGVSLAIPDTRRAPVVRKTTEGAPDSPAPVAPKKSTEPPKPSADGKMSDRLTISGTVAGAGEAEVVGDVSGLGLRLSSDLSVRLSDTVSENARAMLRVEYKLLNALVFQAEKQLELAEQLRNLEARFEEMRAANEGAVKTAGEGLAASKTEPPPAANVPEEKMAVDTVAPKQAPAPVEVPAAETMEWWSPILLLLILAGTLAGWLARRQRARQAADELPADSPDSGSFEMARTIVASEAPTQLDPWDVAEAEAKAAVRSPAFQPDILLDTLRPLPFRDDENARTVPPALAIEVSHVEEADDSGTVLELAEIMVSFGRVKGATQALAEYLESNPDVSLVPWLKLLEIYRTNDMQEEFLACSSQLGSHFNVAAATWDEAGACLGEKIEPLDENGLSIEDMLQKLPTIGAFPHIREKIAQTWDTAEGVSHLKHLLRDTREGQRTGFPLSIAREILFLLDLLETRLRNKS